MPDETFLSSNLIVDGPEPGSKVLLIAINILLTCFLLGFCREWAYYGMVVRRKLFVQIDRF